MNRLMLLAILVPSMCQGAASAALQAAEPVTFNKDIAPLLFARCAGCHRPGEVAPFPLLTYRDAHKRADQIATLLEQRVMPPWHAETGHGDFANGRKLTAAEIALVRSWVDGGAIEGNPADLPAQPQFAAGWQLGEPDLVITLPQAYQLAAEGRDVYRNFVIPLDIPESKFIRAVEFRPGNRRIVHHAGLASDSTHKFRERDGKDGQPGFSQINIPGALLPGSAAFWVPGKQARQLPEGLSFRWPAGADLILQLHLHPSGKPEEERSTIGFYFTNEAPRRSMQHFVLGDGKIDIPPGEASYRTRATQKLHQDCELYGIFPHMHLIGKESKITAILPDGSQQSLLWVDAWDFNWQHYYEYVEPLTLPKGTEIVMENVHDNSDENVANPHHPPRRVVAGEETTNEMSLVLLNVVPKGPAAAAGQGAMQGGKTPADQYAEQARQALTQFDADGDQRLSLDEIIAAAGKQQSRAQLERQLQRFDRNSDQHLDAAELAEAIKVITGG